jgi:hypothetical protein
MHKVDSFGATGANEFTNGDVGMGVPRTRLEAKWPNAVQRELCRVVEQAGITLSDADDGQVVQAVPLQVTTVAALRALAPALSNATLCYIKGSAAADDGGDGFWQWNSASSATDDGETVVRPASNPATGRWLRIFTTSRYRRTAAEITAGVTAAQINFTVPSHEFVGGVVLAKRYLAAGNYTAPGVGTDDSTALRRACLVIQALGGGMLDLGSLRYRIFSDGSTTAIGDFTSLRGVTIRGAGAEIVVDRTFTGSQTVKVFQFTGCNGIHFSGEIKATCTQIQPAFEKPSRGPEWASFLQGCNNVTNDSMTITGFRVCWYILRALADPASYISRGFELGVTNANSTGYPLTTAGATGYGLRARLVTNTCGRSYFPQGLQDHTVEVDSANHEASADCLIANVGATGASGLRLKYTNTRSTTADNTLNCVLVQYQDSDVQTVTHEDVTIELKVKTGAATFLGFALQVGKLKADGTADASARLHVLRNWRISGLIFAENVNQRSIGFCNQGTWSTENVDNVDFSNLRMEGTGQPSFELVALKKKATFNDVYSSAQMNVTGNTTAKVTLTAVECDGSITVDTANTSKHVYVGCKFGSLANQSNTNKSFFDCDGLGTSYSGTLVGTVGSESNDIGFSVNGDLVTLRIPNIQGTSNTNTLSVSGMPAIIRPVQSQQFVGRVQHNGIDQIGWLVRIETTGVITLTDQTGLTTAFNAAGGIKGIGNQTITYRMR